MESIQIAEHRAAYTKGGRSKRRLNVRQHSKPMETSMAPFVKGCLGPLVSLRLSVSWIKRCKKEERKRQRGGVHTI